MKASVQPNNKKRLDRKLSKKTEKKIQEGTEGREWGGVKKPQQRVVGK